MRAFLVLSTVVVSLGLGGCGGCNDNNGVGHLPDAPPPPDTALDAPIDTAPLAAVTVTVTLDGVPQMSLPVYFQESDSAQVSAMQTGADGKASAVVHAGGFVTVVQRIAPLPVTGDAPGELPPGPHSQLYTFAGVKPGDDLHLELDQDQANATEVTFDLSVPNEELGRTYTLDSSCGSQRIGIGQSPLRARQRAPGVGSGASPVTASVTLTGCGGAADMLVVSSDGESVANSWQYKPAVPVADGVPVPLTDDYQAATEVTFTYSGIAPNLNDLSIVRELRSGRGNVHYFSQDLFPDGSTTASLTASLPVVPGLMVVTKTAEDPVSGHGRQTVVELGGGGEYMLDFGAVALRGYDSRPGADAGSHAIAWTEASGGAAPDFVRGEGRLQRLGDDGLNTWTWQIVAPYTGQAKLTYPVLPATFYDYNPGAEEQLDVRQVTTTKAPGGYDAFRARGFNMDPLRALTAPGKIVFEEMFEAIETAKAAPRRAPSGRPAPRKR